MKIKIKTILARNIVRFVIVLGVSVVILLTGYSILSELKVSFWESTCNYLIFIAFALAVRTLWEIVCAVGFVKSGEKQDN